MTTLKLHGHNGLDNIEIKHHHLFEKKFAFKYQYNAKYKECKPKLDEFGVDRIAVFDAEEEV